MIRSDEIRSYCIHRYVKPAIQSHSKSFSIAVRDVHDDLGMQNSYPYVISALKVDKFLSPNNLALLGYEGPKVSPTTVLKFRFLADSKGTKSEKKYHGFSLLILDIRTTFGTVVTMAAISRR